MKDSLYRNKKIWLAISVLLLWTARLQAQPESRINQGISEFFSKVSSLTDRDEPVEPIDLVNDYQNGVTVFKVNGKQKSMLDFLNWYASSVLAGNNITHSANISGIEKLSGGKRYKVIGILKRSFQDEQDNRTIQDESFTMTVLLRKSSYNYLSIQSIDMEMGLTVFSPDSEDVTSGFVGNPYVQHKNLIIQQSKRTPKFFDFDLSLWSSVPDVRFQYSPKYDVGISFMVTPEEWRVGFGFMMMANGAFWRNFDREKASGREYKKTTYTSNGQTITRENHYYSDVSEYSEIIDPYNEVKNYIRRSGFMAQVGVFLNNWVRFDVGAGLVMGQCVHYMKDAYNYTTTTYTPSGTSTPERVEYEYEKAGVSYSYREPENLYFAARAGIDFFIPICKNGSILLGSGYIFVPNNKSHNAFDFSIGYSWHLGRF